MVSGMIVKYGPTKPYYQPGSGLREKLAETAADKSNENLARELDNLANKLLGLAVEFEKFAIEMRRRSKKKKISKSRKSPGIETIELYAAVQPRK